MTCSDHLFCALKLLRQADNFAVWSRWESANLLLKSAAEQLYAASLRMNADSEGRGIFSVLRVRDLVGARRERYATAQGYRKPFVARA